MNVDIVPQGREFLAFSYAQPSDWIAADIPVEEPNFEDPKFFLPVAAAVSPGGSGAFTVGARMSYSDGTLQEWLGFLCREDTIEVSEVRQFSAGAMRGLRFEARQEADGAVMRMSNLYVEDGGRLYAVCAMAAEANFEGIAPTLAAMAESFRPADIQGPTAAPVSDPGQIPATLDPEHPTNRNLRDNGAGLVPRVVDVNRAENYAVLAAGAVSATFRVPLGWHAIDDGRRALLFHTESGVQVSLDRRRRDGETDAQILDGLQATYEENQPDIESVRLELAGMQSLAFRNMRSGDEILEQVFLLRESRNPETVLCARVTSPNGQMADALDAAEIVLSSINEVAA